ncbi:hypothetical protein CBM2623_A120095 [Cupriavidus taiwanensis]|nr:hypothetical protein CBM2608_A110073 [Cupriavidus taiwanensis]SPA25573.1 hypothetical protein CBM2623_A120095 [Cupriavidus taiwanensis]
MAGRGRPRPGHARADRRARGKPPQGQGAGLLPLPGPPARDPAPALDRLQRHHVRARRHAARRTRAVDHGRVAHQWLRLLRLGPCPALRTAGQAQRRDPPGLRRSLQRRHLRARTRHRQVLGGTDRAAGRSHRRTAQAAARGRFERWGDPGPDPLDCHLCVGEPVDAESWGAGVSPGAGGGRLTKATIPRIPLSRKRERGGGEGRSFNEVKRVGTPAPALSPGPSPASGRGEQTAAHRKPDARF